MLPRAWPLAALAATLALLSLRCDALTLASSASAKLSPSTMLTAPAHVGVVTEFTGLLLMAYIYTIDWQLTDDVAVRGNIAKDTSWV